MRLLDRNIHHHQNLHIQAYRRLNFRRLKDTYLQSFRLNYLHIRLHQYLRVESHPADIRLRCHHIHPHQCPSIRLNRLEKGRSCWLFHRRRHQDTLFRCYRQSFQPNVGTCLRSPGSYHYHHQNLLMRRYTHRCHNQQSNSSSNT